MVVAMVAVVSALNSTPWPATMLIRSVFDRGAAKTTAEMNTYAPPVAAFAPQKVTYKNASRLDMHVFKATRTQRAPLVVWIHGGAWISGSNTDVDPYMRILAERGYTSISIGYTVAPEATYPTALEQLNDGLRYITAHAEELGVDATRVVLAGDSAGAQLASQLATLSTSPSYAALLGISPSLTRPQLAGVILNCGVYDIPALADLNGILSWGFKTAMWAYSGTKDWSQTSVASTMSTLNFVTSDFPPTFISGGNGDRLTWTQSIPMSQRLKSLGVNTTELFWSVSHQPALPHEYQFRFGLNRSEAVTALEKTISFLQHLN